MSADRPHEQSEKQLKLITRQIELIRSNIDNILILTSKGQDTLNLRHIRQYTAASFEESEKLKPLIPIGDLQMPPVKYY